ncbi:MBL fold metallo-hydrolase [Caldicellulosiruptoraceae bacterium PP1]
MRNFFEVFNVVENIYHIKDRLNVFVTLIVGKDEAILLDTSYGMGNLRRFIDEFIDLPYKVINSHGHVDHASGNYQFDEVFIHKEDIELCLDHTSEEKRMQRLTLAKEEGISIEQDENEYLKGGPGNLKEIDEGTVFNLGGITVEVIGMPGHTRGSIGLFIKERKLLLTGDAANPFLWLFDKYAANLSAYINTLRKIKELDFNYFLTSHNLDLLPKRRIDDFLECALNIDINKSKPFDHPFFKEYNAYVYNHGNLDFNHPNFASIVFSPEKLK